MDQPVDHHELEASLRRCGSNWTAGQTHGLLCSRLSVGGQKGVARWLVQVLAEIPPDNAMRSECESMLDTLSLTTWRQLVERQSDFVLLLPDDEQSAAMRAEAMGEWCEGYLHGLVADKHRDDLRAKLAAEPLADIIKDMLEITRVTIADESATEEDEGAYVEVVEYLRVAVQLAYEELAEFRLPADDRLPDPTATVH